MASKTNATPEKEEVPKKEGPETPPDSLLLDLSDAAVKKLKPHVAEYLRPYCCKFADR